MRELCTRRSGREDALEIQPGARALKIIDVFANRCHDDRGVGGLPFASDSAWSDGVRALGGAVWLSGVACESRLPALIEGERDDVLVVCREDKQAAARRQESCDSVEKLMARRQPSVALPITVEAHLTRCALFPNVHVLGAGHDGSAATATPTCHATRAVAEGSENVCE
jgi:hypothetical protein